MENLKKIVIIGGIIIIALLAFIAFKPEKKEEATLGSVQIGNEYQKTFIKASDADSKVISTRRGALGSVIINADGAAKINLYDATTTNANLRAGATSTLPLLASLEESITGVYTFDAFTKNGLVVAFNGTKGTTTITWR